jgi:hypothetical protein
MTEHFVNNKVASSTEVREKADGLKKDDLEKRMDLHHQGLPGRSSPWNG